MRILGFLLLLVPVAPAAAQRILYWRDVTVDATLGADGTLRVVERQTIVFHGDWNGGERTFNVRPRQRFRFEGMRRIDSTGQAHVMREGDLSVVDGYEFTDARTLRWRSRLPSDPPFALTPITYELTYSLSNILVPDGDGWLLNHDFGFADRPGVIEQFSVSLGGLAPDWQPTAPFNGRWQGTNIPPGDGFVVRVPLRYAGAGDGPEMTGAEPVERYIIAGVAVILLVSLARRLVDHERHSGRLDPLPSTAEVNQRWLDENVFKHLPEVIGAAWDNKTGASEVAAVLARLVSEGRMKSDVKPGGLFKDPVLHLELLVDRDRFHGHERKLVDALFEAHDRRTDTARIRDRYRKSGFDPASKISKPLKDLVKGLVTGSDPSKPTSLPTVFALLGAIVLMVAAGIREPADAPVLLIGGFVSLLCFSVAVGGAITFRNRVHDVGRASLFFAIPLGIATVGVLGIVISGVTLASNLALAGLTLLLFALANSVLNQARSRENLERIAFRRRLAVARAFFVDELRRDKPRLQDTWFPYLIAFGLGKHMDKWFRAFGGASAAHVGAVTTTSSSGGHGSTSGGGWTGFGGGGGFSGGGASATWVAAASSMAAGVAAPSSSNGGSSGGGGGGSSGGGGGGGW